MSKVYYRDLLKALSDLNDAFVPKSIELVDDANCGTVSIVNMAKDGTIQMGVRLSAVNSQDPDTAMKIAELVFFASMLAKNFRYNGCEIDYSR